MKKHGMMLGVSAIFLLSGCGSTEEQETKSPQSEVQETQTSSEEVTAADDESEEEVILESPYKEIKQHFDQWELPEGGEEGEFVNSVTYENGYTFDKDTKAMIARSWGKNGEEPGATEEQEVGIIMGRLLDAAEIPSPENRTKGNASGQTEPIVQRLEEVKELNDFEPLKEWILETEEIFKAYDDLEDEEKAVVYTKGYEELQKMADLISKDGKEQGS